MIDWFSLAAALIVGIALGIVYFWGLWLTVLRLPGVHHPALLTFGSFLLRSGIVLVGFYLVSGGQWVRLAACLVGFVLARQVMLYRIRPGQKENKI
jgi:F1F0 ATPase subunit 2